jgi:hypothetical protein
MNNTLYNIFAVIGMLNCTAFLVFVLVILYCWLADMWFYYCGRVNKFIMDGDLLTIQSRDGTIVRRVARYEPMEVPPSVDMAFGSKPYLVDTEFHGGRYR